MMVVSVAAGLGLSGCTEPGALDVFSEVQSDEDRFPDDASSNVIDQLDSDSSRLLWTNHGLAYFAALSDDGDTCLVVLENLEAISTCSSSSPIRIESEGGPELLFGNNLPDASEEWVKVADHLWTRP